MNTPIRLISPLILATIAGALGWGILSISGNAQELEPRRWGHLPVDTDFGGAGYAFTTGEVLFDPVLLVEDAELDMHTGVVKYIRTFEFFDKLARFGFTQGYQNARWSGLLDGVETSTTRSGLSDTLLRFSMNLIGSPPLAPAEFKEFRKAFGDHETIVGAGVVVHLPTGHYLDDKLLNLGSNRFTIRPQLGAVHTRGKLSMELTGSAWIFSDNDDFWNGNQLEQEPLYTVQGHLVYNFKPGVWISTGAAWGHGSQSTLNGILKDDQKTNVGFGVSAGYPITPKLGMKVGYVGLRAQERVGVDLNNFVLGFSAFW